MIVHVGLVGTPRGLTTQQRDRIREVAAAIRRAHPDDIIVAHHGCQSYYGIQDGGRALHGYNPGGDVVMARAFKDLAQAMTEGYPPKKAHWFGNFPDDVRHPAMTYEDRDAALVADVSLMIVMPSSSDEPRLSYGWSPWRVAELARKEGRHAWVILPQGMDSSSYPAPPVPWVTT